MAVILGDAVAYLVLDADGFNRSIAEAQSAISSLDTSSAASMQHLAAATERAGYSWTTNVSAPIVESGKSAMDAYIDYEKAITGIRKTIDDAEIAEAFGLDPNNANDVAKAYSMLSDKIEEMAVRTGMSAEELARVGEVSGQLGVAVGKDGETILKFMEIMAKLGVTTDLTAENAALSLARFLNITNVAQDDVDKIGSAIVDLGNNFATQEPEIVNMATRLASAGKLAGLTAQEILALSTAMSSAGIKTEAGASSMSQFINTMTRAVELAGTAADEDGSWAKKLEEAASVAGMSAEEFQERWRNKPIEAIQAFLSGLKNVNEEGESTVLILDDLGLNAIRVGNMTRSLALSSDMLADAINTSNEAYEENNALEVEFEKYASTNAQALARLREEWDALRRDFGELLIPVLQKLMEIAKSFIEFMRGLSPEAQKVVIAIAAITAAVGPLLIVIGKVMSAIAVIGALTGKMNAAPLALINRCHQLGDCAQLTAGKITGVGTSIGGVMKIVGGIASVLAGVWMAVTSFFDMWNNGFSIAKEAVMAIGIALAAVGAILLGAPAAVAAVVAAVVALVATAVIVVKDHWEDIKEAFRVMGERIKEHWDNVCEWFKKAGGAVVDWFKDTFVPAIKEWAKGLAKFLMFGTDTLIKGIMFIVNEIIPWLANFFSEVFGKIGDALAKIWGSVSSWFEEVGAGIVAFFGKIIDWLANLFSSIGEKISAAKDFIVGLIHKIGDAMVAAFEFIFGNAWEKLKTLGKTVVETLKTIIGSIGEVFSTLKGIFDEIMSKLGSAISSLLTLIGDTFGKVLNTMKKIYQETVGAVAEVLSVILEKLGEGFKNAAEKLGEKLEEIWAKIKEFPMKVYETGKEIIEKLWDGMKSVWDGVKSWFEDNFGWLLDMIKSIIDGIKSIANSKPVQKVKDWINGSHANGLEYVPYDGYIAELHKGERVLTRSENQDYSSGNYGNGGGDVYNFYNTQSDPYEIARQVRRTKKELAFAQ